MRYYPICLDIKGRKCLVVGGGRVAERKAKGLLASGAIVTVVSPELTEGLESLLAQGQVSWFSRGYQAGDVEPFFVVIAATDNIEVQKQVYNEADNKGILVNVADVPERCSFILPAQVKRGDLTISISTAGKSPALAKKLRRKLEKTFGNEYVVLVEILGKIRSAILGRGLSQKENEAIFNTLLETDILAWIQLDNWEQIQSSVSDICEYELTEADLAEIKRTVKIVD